MVVIIIVAGAVWGIIKFKNRNNPENQPQVYDALVNVVDQKTNDPVEDAKSSLKAGDVIVYFPEGHPWSDTEKNSYLIVKLKLKPADAAKLTQAKTVESKKPTSPAGGQETNNKEQAGPGAGSQTETVLARQYRLNLPSFDVQKFWGDHQQPFADKIFNSSIIQKK